LRKTAATGGGVTETQAIDIDLAKQVFQLHGVDSHKQVVCRKPGKSIYAQSFVRKDGGEPPADGTRNPYADFEDEKRSNPTHRSKTNPEARLARKNNGDASRLAHMAHTMIEHRSGLIVDVECTELNGHAEIEVALAMLKRTAKPGSTVGADKNHDQQAFVQGARKLKVTPHMARTDARRVIRGMRSA
jgi:hypothetical protein